MIGILIIAHGTLGESFIQCAKHVLGDDLPLIAHARVTAEDDPAVMLPQLQQVVRHMDQGDGVLVLTDMYGATPSNIACRLVEPGKVEAVAGINLPMLIRALSYRDKSLPVMVDKALAGGSNGLVHITREVCCVATTDNSHK